MSTQAALALMASAISDIASLQAKQASALDHLSKALSDLSKGGSGYIASSGDATEVGAKRKRVKRVKLPGQPKKPSTSYLLFVQHRRNAGLPDGKTGKDVLTELGAEWKTLSPEERAPFEKEAAELNAAYKAEMDKFKAANVLESEAKRPRVGSDAATDDEAAAPAKTSKPKEKEAKPAVSKPAAAPAASKPASAPPKPAAAIAKSKKADPEPEPESESEGTSDESSAESSASEEKPKKKASQLISSSQGSSKDKDKKKKSKHHHHRHASSDDDSD